MLERSLHTGARSPSRRLGTRRAFPESTASSMPGKRSPRLVFGPIPVGENTITSASSGSASSKRAIAHRWHYHLGEPVTKSLLISLFSGLSTRMQGPTDGAQPCAPR